MLSPFPHCVCADARPVCRDALLVCRDRLPERKISAPPLANTGGVTEICRMEKKNPGRRCPATGIDVWLCAVQGRY